MVVGEIVVERIAMAELGFGEITLESVGRFVREKIM